MGSPKDRFVTVYGRKPVLEALDDPMEIIRAQRERKRVERFSGSRRVVAKAGKPKKVPALDAWALPMPSIAKEVISRTAYALPWYGPDFRYEHRFLEDPVFVAAVAVGAAGLLAAAHVPPLRRMMDRV
ncbi:hypothetical protein ACFQ1S_43735, partial [Kibdelosporangium lantanae]